MANTQTTVPLFVANTVLTAAQQNISAGTGVPVFATTVTRDAAFGGSNKALAEGQLAYIEASNVVQYYDGAAWATVGPATAGGLVFISSASPSAVASVSINNCFSSTYQNYRVLINYTSSVGADALTTMRLRVGGTDSTTGYKSQLLNAGSVGGVTTSADASGTDDWYVTYLDPSTGGNLVILDIFNPFAAAKTNMRSDTGYTSSTPNYYVQSTYALNTAATSYDGFTVLTGGTSFTGTIRVYGYANS